MQDVGERRALSHVSGEQQPDEAGKLAAEAAATMKPFPQDEKNPLAAAGPDVPGDRLADNLIL